MPRGVYERKGTPTVKTTDDTTLAAQEKVGGALHRTTPTRLANQEDTMDTAYVALKPMKVAGAKVNPGEIVADASNWRNVHNYVSSGYLALVAAPPAGGGGGRF